MLPTGLSMLWESVEPAAALRERFGFDGFEAATAWCAGALAGSWGLRAHGLRRMVISGRNAILWADSDRGGLVVKLSGASPSFARLEASTRLQRSLAEQGIPVAEPLASAAGADRAVVDGPSGAISIAVFPELTGDWLDVGDEAAVRAAGACLARLHRALGAVAESPALASWRIVGLRERISTWLASEDHGHAPDASHRLARLLADAPELDDEPQLVHNDFRAANILTRDATITGVLDFDEVLVTHRVHDLAKAGVYLGTRFRNWRPTTRTVRDGFRAGYESVRPLSRAERHWLETLTLWHGLQAIPGSHDPAAWAMAV